MSTSLSVAEILSKLETRIAHHEQQVAFHKQQESHHRERSAAHAAELEKLRQHFESFKAAALPAADLAGVPVASETGEEEPEDLSEFVGRRIMISKLVARVVDSIGEGYAFGAAWVAQETNRRFHSLLKRPVDARTVSNVLRRLRNAGALRQVQPGGAAHGEVFAKRGGG